MFKKISVSCFLIVWLSVLVIDAAPRMGQRHSDLKAMLDPYLDVTGLWQGGWAMFAPEPDKINAALKADITYSDGLTSQWRSPTWRSLTAWERFLKFREAEYIDNVRMDYNVAAWSGLGNYLARTVPHPEDSNQKPIRIILTREWVYIPPPDPNNITQFPEVHAMDGSYIFFARDIKP